MLKIRNASMGFGKGPLFDPVSVDVPPGEVMLLSAPSGGGKSTLLAWICGSPPAELEASGTVSLNDRSLDGLATEDRRIGIMFQDPLLFPHLTVGSNLAFGLASGGSSQQRKKRISQALDATGMAGLEDRDPATLSGGQKARAALMRTLLAEPDALLLDEPFSSLDGHTRDAFISLVLTEIRNRDLPTILVSHDPRDAECATLTPLMLGKSGE
jgi:putative thiamine transport system ATP-binding protein